MFTDELATSGEVSDDDGDHDYGSVCPASCPNDVLSLSVPGWTDGR